MLAFKSIHLTECKHFAALRVIPMTRLRPSSTSSILHLSLLIRYPLVLLFRKRALAMSTEWGP